jgi:hypothetical protein
LENGGPALKKPLRALECCRDVESNLNDPGHYEQAGQTCWEMVEIKAIAMFSDGVACLQSPAPERF